MSGMAGGPTVLPAVVHKGQLECRAAPRTLWAMLSDVERLYRAFGQGPLGLEPLADATAARYRLRTPGRDGMPALVEEPSEWNTPGLLVLTRRLERGPLRTIRCSFALTPLLQGTRLELEVSIEPASPGYALIAKLYGWLTLYRLQRAIQRIDQAQQLGENPLRRVSPTQEAAARSAFEQAAVELSPDQVPALEKLLTLLRGLDDLDAARLQPLAHAEALFGLAAPSDPESGEPACVAVSEAQIIGVFLPAAARGLVALSWDVMCASCRQPALRCARLSLVPAEVRCHFCDVEVVIDLAKNVEVSFRPAPKVRPLPDGVYAAGGPARAPHVVSQWILHAASRRSIPVPGEPGTYVLRVRGGLLARLNVSTLGPPNAEVVIGEQMTPAQIEVAQGGTLELIHEGTVARHLRLERPDAVAPFLSAHAVIMHPAFRRLFPGELLKAGLCRAVPPIGLLLSELVGVVELAQKLGDHAATRMMIELQDLLRTVVESAGGALVRLERDGLFAVFSDGPAAVQAGVELQEAMARFQGASVEGGALQVRIGVCAGAAQLLTQNRTLDYYGLSVVLCARLLRDAHGGDVLLPAELAQSLEKNPLAKVGPRFTIGVKGLDAPLGVCRVNYQPPSRPAEATPQSGERPPPPPQAGSPQVGS